MDTKTKLTKIDIMVLMFCIFLIIFVTGTIGKRGQELNKRLICSGNIKQLIGGMTNYAYENTNRFPTGGGFWPCDVSSTAYRTLLRYMGMTINQTKIPVQDVFYCPSNLTRKVGRDSYWNMGAYCEAGYAWLWQAPWNQYGQLPILGTGNKKWVFSIYIDNPSETELIVDAVFSQKASYDPVQFPNGNFGQITCGGIPSSGFYDMSNHLKTTKEPYGGNIGFVDGHVRWRPFGQMQLRHIYSNNSPSGDPRWWW